MSENTAVKRIVKVASELGVGVDHVIEFLHKSGHTDIGRNSKIDDAVYGILIKEFQSEKAVKAEVTKQVASAKPKEPEEAPAVREEEITRVRPEKEMNIKVVSKIDLDTVSPKAKPEPPKAKAIIVEEPVVIKPEVVAEKPPV